MENTKISLEEYKSKVADYLKDKGIYSEREIENLLEKYHKEIQDCLNRGYSAQAVGVMLYNEL